MNRRGTGRARIVAGALVAALASWTGSAAGAAPGSRPAGTGETRSDLPVLAQPGYSQTMEAIIAAYLPIPVALAADRGDGVAAAARQIATLAARLDGLAAPSLPGVPAAWLADLPERIAAGATALAAAAEIEAQRRALQALSKPLIRWVHASGRDQPRVAYCSMYPGAWLQAGEQIANPYYGSRMLRCGEVLRPR